MKQGDIGWSEKRRQSSRMLAYYFESQGRNWTSIREAVRDVAAELGISAEKKRRSQLAIECQDRLADIGIKPPVGYLPPWLRGESTPILRQPTKRTKDAALLAFYDSFEWKRVRFAVLTSRGRTCECCGADSRTVVMHVDHIKPLRKYWHLRLEPDNLQVLCEWCNHGKGAKYETDFRS